QVSRSVDLKRDRQNSPWIRAQAGPQEIVGALGEEFRLAGPWPCRNDDTSLAGDRRCQRIGLEDESVRRRPVFRLAHSGRSDSMFSMALTSSPYTSRRSYIRSSSSSRASAVRSLAGLPFHPTLTR